MQAKKGLDSLGKYLLYFDIEWDLEEYYKTLPLHMEEIKKNKI
ncbi:hypothetical protein [Flammeovirga pectinis]|nr:hypothetical protein [Flammeovirga pectinis]